MTAIRTLLTVVVAAALLGASFPAVDDARVDRTGARLDTTATRIADTAAALVAVDDPVHRDEQGASRTVIVTLPSEGFTDARADYLSIGGTPNASHPTTIGYRVTGQPAQRIETSVRFATGATPLVLTPGRHALRLTLVRTPAGVGVRVHLAARRSPTAAANTSGTASPTDSEEHRFRLSVAVAGS